jgi:hypothetical protein
MKIGKAHQTVRSASSFRIFLFGPPICNVKLLANSYVRDVASVRYYWRRVHRCANTLALGASVRQYIGAGCIGAPICWRTDVPLRQ